MARQAESAAEKNTLAKVLRRVVEHHDGELLNVERIEVRTLESGELTYRAFQRGEVDYIGGYVPAP